MGHLKTLLIEYYIQQQHQPLQPLPLPQLLPQPLYQPLQPPPLPQPLHQPQLQPLHQPQPMPIQKNELNSSPRSRKVVFTLNYLTSPETIRFAADSSNFSSGNCSSGENHNDSSNTKILSAS